ncbi:MAG TPA: hypothetical protein VFF52_15470 [Isosphaeraceae bacterium]|nr:hypothetical protein [Isosphaeraceae bacterium]
MSDFRWKGNGPEFLTVGRGRAWRLHVGASEPGPTSSDERSYAKLLALQSIAAIGRPAERAFGGATLREFARRQGCVQATYSPPGWGGLTVRATWGPTRSQGGLDLEVQLSATSVGQLKRVEVGIISGWTAEPAESAARVARWVEPRDIPSAASSYDGRESADTLAALTTLPVPLPSWEMIGPRILSAPGFDADTYYVEMVQPHDCARRILDQLPGGPAPNRPNVSTRYGLFGHDLEKGVVLRARLRGLWIRSQTPVATALALFEEFLREPPPLGP